MVGSTHSTFLLRSLLHCNRKTKHSNIKFFHALVDFQDRSGLLIAIYQSDWTQHSKNFFCIPADVSQEIGGFLL